MTLPKRNTRRSFRVAFEKQNKVTGYQQLHLLLLKRLSLARCLLRALKTRKCSRQNSSRSVTGWCWHQASSGSKLLQMRGRIVSDMEKDASNCFLPASIPCMSVGRPVDAPTYPVAELNDIPQTKSLIHW